MKSSLLLALLALLVIPLTIAAEARAEQVRVACVGDSITEGSGYPGELQKMLGAGFEVKNFGVSSTTLLAKGEKPWVKEKKAQEAFAFQPQRVVIMLGTNDTKPQNYAHVAGVERDLTELVQSFATLPSKPRVWLATPCPVYYDGNWGIDNGRLNEGVLPAIRNTAAALNLPLIDMNAAMSHRTDLFYKDNVHPLGGGAIMAATVFTALTGQPAPIEATPPPPEQARVACIGDSITAGSGYPAALQHLLGNRWNVRNFGVSGATLLRAGDKPFVRESKWRAALDFRPHAVLLMLGTNDTKPQNYAHIAGFEANLGAMIDELAQLPTRPRIFLCKPVPVIGEGNFGIDNARLEEGVLPAIERVATERRLPLIDMNAALRGRDELFKDRVHPQGAQELMARAAFAVLRREMPPEAVKTNLLANGDTERGAEGWMTRGGRIAIVSEPVHSGSQALATSGRTSAWHGPGQDVAAALRQHGKGWYRFVGSVRLGAGAKASPSRIQIMMPSGYLGSQSRTATAEAWTEFDDIAYLTWTGELKTATLYVETNNATADVIVDDFALEPLLAQP